MTLYKLYLVCLRTGDTLKTIGYYSSLIAAQTAKLSTAKLKGQSIWIEAVTAQ